MTVEADSACFLAFALASAAARAAFFGSADGVSELSVASEGAFASDDSALFAWTFSALSGAAPLSEALRALAFARAAATAAFFGSASGAADDPELSAASLVSAVFTESPPFSSACFLALALARAAATAADFALAAGFASGAAVSFSSS